MSPPKSYAQIPNMYPQRPNYVGPPRASPLTSKIPNARSSPPRPEKGSLVWESDCNISVQIGKKTMIVWYEPFVKAVTVSEGVTPSVFRVRCCCASPYEISIALENGSFWSFADRKPRLCLSDSEYKFSAVSFSGNRFSLKHHKEKYLSAKAHGSITTGVSKCGPSEKFVIQRLDNSKSQPHIKPSIQPTNLVENSNFNAHATHPIGPNRGLSGTTRTNPSISRPTITNPSIVRHPGNAASSLPRPPNAISVQMSRFPNASPPRQQRTIMPPTTQRPGAAGSYLMPPQKGGRSARTLVLYQKPQMQSQRFNSNLTKNIPKTISTQPPQSQFGAPMGVNTVTATQNYVGQLQNQHGVLPPSVNHLTSVVKPSSINRSTISNAQGTYNGTTSVSRPNVSYTVQSQSTRTQSANSTNNSTLSAVTPPMHNVFPGKPVIMSKSMKNVTMPKHSKPSPAGVIQISGHSTVGQKSESFR
eukprot:746205_1